MVVNNFKSGFSYHKNSGNPISSPGLDLQLQWRKTLPRRGGLFATVVLLLVLNHLRSVKAPGTWMVSSAMTIVSTSFDKNTSGYATMPQLVTSYPLF